MEHKMIITCKRCGYQAPTEIHFMDPNQVCNAQLVLCKTCGYVFVQYLNSEKSFELTEEIFQGLPENVQSALMVELIKFIVMQDYSDEVRAKAIMN